jgi:hypothetical protein
MRNKHLIITSGLYEIIYWDSDFVLGFSGETEAQLKQNRFKILKIYG